MTEFPHVINPRLRRILESATPTRTELSRAVTITLKAAWRDSQREDVPGPVAAAREDFAEAAQDALERRDYPACHAALKEFWSI